MCRRAVFSFNFLLHVVHVFIIIDSELKLRDTQRLDISSFLLHAQCKDSFLNSTFVFQHSNVAIIYIGISSWFRAVMPDF